MRSVPSLAAWLSISLLTLNVSLTNKTSAAEANAKNLVTLNFDKANKMAVTKYDNNPQKSNFSATKKFTIEPDLPAGNYIYIVELKELSLAQDPLSVKELRSLKRNNRVVNARQSFAMKRQLEKIETQQQSFLDKASAQTFGVKAINRFKYGINGVSINVSQEQAQILAQLPQVKRIQRQQSRRLNTDRGPTLIGAPKVWDGSAFSSVAQTQGEGIVIGIIDSGINSDHPSFAEVSGDGYLHTNPLGNGVYLGDCAGNFAEMCNSKLIGVYSYPEITNKYSDTDVFPPNLPRNGEDYGGHGSHVAGIAAGNILTNIAEVFPTQGEENSTGTPTGFIFSQISGVAPRANIISYQVCFGGSKDRDDKYGDCLDTPILQAIDDAIKDNVDVINFSISGGGDPWSDLTDQAFLSAQNAGIFVAASAGNDGPQASTSDKNAPWYTSVAASEHGREIVYLKEINGFTGGTGSPNPIVGQSNTGTISAAIVYAGNFANVNDPNGDSAQCLQPFPAGTFNGQIVVCDRGEIARLDKAINVSDGGAGGFVLANISTGERALYNDQYVIPGIQLNQDNGDILKAWLATGQNHRATITAGEYKQFIDEARVDVIADFSSRGPSLDYSVLVPTLSAPGKAIYSAYANEQLGHDGHEPAASNFDSISGTSMSSPHVAGAAALVKASNPSWNADQIRSALALTATSIMKTDDDDDNIFTEATFFEMGSGRIQVDKAIASPLIMSETSINYTNADPQSGGDPRSLNLPSITDNNCAARCSWSRTFTATTNATFNYESITISPGLVVDAVPSTFSLSKGQTQNVSFTINASQASKIDYSFALARFTSSGLPDVSLPISILSTLGGIPLDIQFDGRRTTDTVLLKNNKSVDLSSFELTAYKPIKATVVEDSIAEDDDINSYLDDLTDGVSMTTVTVPDDARRLAVKLDYANNADLDVFVVYDGNENGVPSISEQIASSRLANSPNEISINYPQAGTYFIVVQNYSGSSNLTDDFTLSYAVVTNELAENSLQAYAPISLDADIPFDIRVTYSLPESQSGDLYFASIAMGNNQEPEDLGLISIDISRIDDDVFVDGPASRLQAGDSVPFIITVKNNPTDEDRHYKIVLPLPVGTQFTSFSSINNGQEINNELVWQVNKAAGSGTDTVLNFTLLMLEGIQAGPVPVIVKTELSSPIITPLEAGTPFSDVQIEGPPVISFNGNTNAELTIIETKTLVIPLTINEPNNDQFTVEFVQTSGPSVTIIDTSGIYTLEAPLVDADTQFTYDLSVIDINGNTASSSMIINVLNNGTPEIISIDAPVSANGGQNIIITVTASDPENDSLVINVNGSVISGNTTTLRTPTVGSSVSYNITVSDGITQATQTVSVNLSQVAPPASSGGGGSFSFWLMLLIPLALIRRYKAKVNC